MKCPYCIKQCSKCGRLLVANTMNFPKRKEGKYGVRNECKECYQKYYKKYHQDNKEEVNKKHRQYHLEHKEEINKRKKQYYQDNKDKIRETDRQYYQDNKEMIKEKCKQHYQDNKEMINEKHKQYYQDNKDWFKKYHQEYDKEYYNEHKEEILAHCKEYRKNNPDKVFNQNNKRRLLEENQGNGITKEQWLDMMQYFNWECAYSGVQLNKNNRSVDHVIPLNKNGMNEIWNCVPMEKGYNSSKCDKDMLDWYCKQSYYSEERLNKIYQWVEYAKNKYQK